MSLISLILQKNLRGMFCPEVSEFHLRSYILKKLIKYFMPNLWTHLRVKLQVQFEFLTTQWLMTWFTGWITDERYLLPIFDNLVATIYEDADEDDAQASWLFLFSVILSIFK